MRAALIDAIIRGDQDAAPSLVREFHAKSVQLLTSMPKAKEVRLADPKLRQLCTEHDQELITTRRGAYPHSDGGVEVRRVDMAARKSLQKSDLAQYFSHSTGHGVGLEIHEAPRMARGQQEILRPGMVITIEPGVYLPGQWGVRIEDMVVVTEQDCEVLSPKQKEFIVI